MSSGGDDSDVNNGDPFDIVGNDGDLSIVNDNSNVGTVNQVVITITTTTIVNLTKPKTLKTSIIHLLATLPS